MSGGDLLGDIFEPQLGSPASSKSSREDISFDFDPDAPSGGNSTAKAVDLFCEKEAVAEDNLEDMFGGPASTSTPARSTSSGGVRTDSETGINTVDPDELRRRIRGGGGSEQPSRLQ